jgi:hypothetical protein
MKLLKIGATTINIDQVNHIDDNEDQIIITFDNSVGYPTGSITINNADEAKLLRRWIMLNSEDVSEASEDSTGAALGEPQPYISTR